MYRDICLPVDSGVALSLGANVNKSGVTNAADCFIPWNEKTSRSD